MTAISQRIIPNLWFDRQAEEAARFYASVFKNSRVSELTRAGKAGFEVTGIPEGAVVTVEFELEGHRFIAINGGPLFKFNPSVSFLVACETRAEVDSSGQGLSPGGAALMELGEYPFSRRYGWAQDRYGLSWQIMFMGDIKTKQKITPTLMFVGGEAGKAEQAINLYVSIFHNAGAGDILRYGKGEAPDREGTIKHAAFTLEGQEFAAMDSAIRTPSASTRPYRSWCSAGTRRKSTTTGPSSPTAGRRACAAGSRTNSASRGRLRPRSWRACWRDPDKARTERVTSAFLKMKKFDVAALLKAYRESR